MPAKHRAIRFQSPWLPSATETGLAIDPRGSLATVDGHASVRQSLLILLSTSRGERVMRPEYGCDLQHLVFAPNDDTTAGLAIHYVREAIEMWEPRVELLLVDANSDPDRAEVLVITLSYRVLSTQTEDEMNLRLDLSEGATP